MAAGFPTFRPRLPWLGADLQTMRNTFVPPRVDLAGYESERLILPLGDGTGDALAALLQRPAPHAGHRPLVVLIHGLTGTEDSAYMMVSAGVLLSRGHPVVRLNLRGAGPSRPLCRLQYHAGRTADLRAALLQLEPHWRDRGLHLVGYSLGGNMLLKFLAEYAAAFPIRAAAAVSVPLDLAASCRRILMPRNRIYHWNLLRYMKAEALAPASELSPVERQRVRAARSILEFDDGFVAPRNGYADAAEYYATNSAARFLAAIRVPTLVIHALDDPWIPPGAYERHPWAENPNLIPLLSPGGGHVGFHDRDSREVWHDRCLLTFLEQTRAIADA
jgi:predicted alpha/beta-fold hydrolase